MPKFKALAVINLYLDMAKNYVFATRLQVIFWFSFLLYTHLQAQSVADIDHLRNQAEELYAQGDYDHALAKYLDAYRLAHRLDFVLGG